MKTAFCFVLLMLVQFITCSIGYGQTKDSPHSFHLTGTIKADTGTVFLRPMGGKDFDPNTANNYTATIKQGHFTFDGTLLYPAGFVIAFFPNYISSPFIVETGTQSIVCQIDSIREIPIIDNKSMRALSMAPVNFFSRFVLSVKQRRRLLDYVKQHPDSYVGLWESVRQVNEGYAPILDSIYASFSTTLQHTYTGKVMAQRLASSKVTGTGQVFPTLKLLDINRKPVSIPTRQKATYMLIDFWYARCSACIDQFPSLKALFDMYHAKGFDIAGISIDKQVDINLWKSTIQKRELVWSHYVDVGGKLTINQLSIGYFPSNFLLDEQGVIVKKNISPVELSKFLSKNL
jgi:peroxiredoxin